MKSNEEQLEENHIYEPPTLRRLIVQRFEGEICEGQFHEKGVAFFEGGHTYKGEFLCNTPKGEGTYTQPDGSFYSGDVCNGIRHGLGTYMCAKSSVSYKGQWHQGKRHGKGTVYYNQSKTSWYKGYWVKNCKEGWGVRCYNSGNIYFGEWKSNRRHGQGTMRWQKLRQQYAGEWIDGVQHGHGTHVWILQRSNWGHYSQSNQYTGDFVQGQRHGRGSFYYAGGAVYEGEWKSNKKHGKGKFTFKDGRVFEGEFEQDQMITFSLHKNSAPNLLCGGSSLSISELFTFDMGLNIERLLDMFPERRRNTELQQVEFVALQKNTELRSIYSFYRGLGQTHTSLLSHLQLLRLLKDCKIHHHGISLPQVEYLIKEDETAENQFPFTPLQLHRFISCLVIVAFHTYNKDMTSAANLLAACFSKLLTDDIIPNAKNVKGFLFRHPSLSVTSMSYMERCWQIYKTYCSVSTTDMTYRHLLWMFKDLQLLDNNLTLKKLLELITAESADCNNLSSCLNLEITFLEAFEVLVGCADMQHVSEDLEGSLHLSRCNTQEKTSKRLLANRNCSPQSTGKSITAAEYSLAHNLDKQHIVIEESEFEDHTEEEDKDKKTKRIKSQNCEIEVCAQKIHQFLNHVFFPAFEHYQSVNSCIKEKRNSFHENQTSSHLEVSRARTQGDLETVQQT
ncbi:radial spoke head 10 homolog B isoform X2 [Betta splendens]|uniref:Radial spoke head 10 homolog B isoform X2 n=1 Tax=Betta splendens TaxID=158456 RepID=A0A9W2XG57_BETSP|nr:radial spoke head 10 homolog B isoform X2 [Betta splendens]